MHEKKKKEKKINAFESQYEKFKLAWLIIELIKCTGKCILKC